MTHSSDSPAFDRSAQSSDTQPIWIAAILVLAAALRIWGLDASLWYDEIDTLVRYVRLPTGTLIQTYDSLNNHMFFSLQAQASVAIFGESAWAVRLPAMLFGLASIWALWRLSLELTGIWQARLAALLMAVSYHHIWFSQNARGYTGLLFFGLLATLFLMRGIRQPTLGAWLCYGLCFAAAMYTHLSAAFLFLSHGLVYLLWVLTRSFSGEGFDTRRLTAPLIGVGVGVLIVLLLYAPVFGQLFETFGGVQKDAISAEAEASIAEWKSPLWLFQEIAASFSAFGPVAPLIFPAVLFVLFLGLLSISRTSVPVALILPVHAVATVGLLVILSFRVWPRYFVIDLGLICLALVLGAFTIAGWLTPMLRGVLGPKTSRTSIGIAFVSVGVLASIALLPANYRYPKQDYVGVVDYVEANRAEGSTVITLGLSSMPFEAYYAPDWAAADTLETFSAHEPEARETWVVYTFPRVIERRHADIFEAMGNDFQKVEYFHGTLSGGGIVVLKNGG